MHINLREFPPRISIAYLIWVRSTRETLDSLDTLVMSEMRTAAIAVVCCFDVDLPFVLELLTSIFPPSVLVPLTPDVSQAGKPMRPRF
jgi:hypothetical protein